MKFWLVALFFPVVGLSQTAAAIDSLFSSLDDRGQPALAVAVKVRGDIVYKRTFGMANFEYDIPASDSSIFDVASIAKQVTSACIWVLINNQKISLDDDIRKYLPEMPVYDRPILVRHLLNHTSGIRNYHSLMTLSGFDYDRDYYDNNSVLTLVSRQENLNNSPGGIMHYGNSAYNLLAIIIERISIQNLNDFAREHLLEPLGMHHTFFQTNVNEIRKNKAVAYVKSNGTYIQNPHVHCSYGAGSLFSTANDLLLWTDMLNGQSKQFDQLQAFLKTLDDPHSGYARGIMAGTYNGFKTWHHSGNGTGVNAQLITLPEKQIAVVLLSATSRNVTGLSYRILDLLIPDDASPVDKATWLPGDPNAYTGTYLEMRSDMQLELFVENDTLKSKGSGASVGTALLPTGKDAFIRKGNSTVTYSFCADAQRDADLCVNFDGNRFYFQRMQQVKPPDYEASDFVGDYYSTELATTYQFSRNGNELMLTYQGRAKVKLRQVLKDVFGSGDRIRYTFLREKNGAVGKLLVCADGSIKDITFTKNTSIQKTIRLR